MLFRAVVCLPLFLAACAKIVEGDAESFIVQRDQVLGMEGAVMEANAFCARFGRTSQIIEVVSRVYSRHACFAVAPTARTVTDAQ